jgi:hypothetical protein
VNGCDGARRATETTPVTLKHPHRTYPTGGESMLPYASRAACGCSSQPISALARCWGWGILHDDAWIEISRIGFHGRHTVLLRTVRACMAVYGHHHTHVRYASQRMMSRRAAGCLITTQAPMIHTCPPADNPQQLSPPARPPCAAHSISVVGMVVTLQYSTVHTHREIRTAAS